MLRPWEKHELALRDRLISPEPPDASWAMMDRMTNGYMWDCRKLGLRVRQSVVEADGQLWIHTSLSRHCCRIYEV